MVQSKLRISFIYASYRGPMIPWIRLVKLKIRTCKLGSENTSWIRKYHKYDKIDRKIRNYDIFSIECKKTRWKYIKYYVRDN